MFLRAEMTFLDVFFLFGLELEGTARSSLETVGEEVILDEISSFKSMAIELISSLVILLSNNPLRLFLSFALDRTVTYFSTLFSFVSSKGSSVGNVISEELSKL